ncbi:MAG: type 1 glutamine amidotransferase [Pseudomonadota bacterium]
MRIAILITNTDVSQFAQTRPHDGEKFTSLLHEVRPDWATEWFWAWKGDLPKDINAFNGVLVTGSPASVNDGAGWIDDLEALVRSLIDDAMPLFGVCFGHQLIARALGAHIVTNPFGWSHGLLEIDRVLARPWDKGLPDHFALYGSHIEQVDRLPQGATPAFRSAVCPVAGFALGAHVLTVQHHPEMTHEFVTDLVETYADTVGEATTIKARASLARKADRGPFAELIARFFEAPARSHADDAE